MFQRTAARIQLLHVIHRCQPRPPHAVQIAPRQVQRQRKIAQPFCQLAQFRVGRVFQMRSQLAQQFEALRPFQRIQSARRDPQTLPVARLVPARRNQHPRPRQSRQHVLHRLRCLRVIQNHETRRALRPGRQRHPHLLRLRLWKTRQPHLRATCRHFCLKPGQRVAVRHAVQVDPVYAVKAAPVAVREFNRQLRLPDPPRSNCRRRRGDHGIRAAQQRPRQPDQILFAARKIRVAPQHPGSG